MLDRLKQPATIVLLLILANAASIPFFRFFLTLDGPMHVLHACVLKSICFSGRYATPAVDYWIIAQGLDLGDLLLIPLTWLFTPEVAHAVFAALVLLVLCLGAWWVAQGAGSINPALFVWVLPLSFSFTFILGFFNFHLACGLALVCLGWWMRRRLITWRSLAGLLIGISLCQTAHRSGGALAILLVGCYEAVLLVRFRGAWRQRWGMIHPIVRRTLPPLVLFAAVVQVMSIVLIRPRTLVHADAGSLQGLLQLRPLLLFDRAGEAPFLLALGVLLIATLAMGLCHRLNTRNASAAADALLLAAMVMLGASLILRTPNADLLYLGPRLQAMALVLLAVWTATVVPFSRWSLVLGTLVLGVHVGRMMQAERRMAGSRPTYEFAMQVVERLPQRGVALPIVEDDNWMHEHLTAFAAASYRGVFFHAGDHLAFRHGPAAGRVEGTISFGYPSHLNWLEDHVSQNKLPVFDHIVLFGQGKPARLRTRNVSAVLSRHYFLQWTNGYAQIWVLRENDGAP